MNERDAASDVHVFQNGVKVKVEHLLPYQRAAYGNINLHEPEETDLFGRLLDDIDPGGVFVDVGAAIGYYVILAKARVPQLEVHAFEPNQRQRQFLLDNLLLNGLTDRDVLVHPQAVSASCTTSKFRIAGPSSSLARTGMRGWLVGLLRTARRLLRPAPKAMPPIPVTTVQTTTLDVFLKTVDKPIELVMLDVQGFEVDVLKGARNALAAGRVRRWLIGTHSDRKHAACRRILQKAGYNLRHDQQAPPNQPDGILLATN